MKEPKDTLGRRALLGGAVWLVGFGPALAKKAKVKIPAIAPGQAARVISGQSFMLADGRTVRLACVQAPRMAYDDIRAEPMAQDARSALNRLVTGHTLSFTDRAPDKFSRLKAHVFTDREKDDAPIWVQGELVRLGFARVQTWRDDRARAAALLLLEEEARNAKRGLWAQTYFAVRNPDSISASVGSFQIVKGRIIDAANVRGRVYLNFGADWRNDFTISIGPKETKAFERAGIKLVGLSGAMVQARGMIRSQNGPILYLDHPEALEVF